MAAESRDGSQLSRFEATTGTAMVGLALAVVPIYVTQALADDASVWVTRSLATARLGIQITLGVEVAVRTYLAPERWRFLAAHKLDVLAIAAPPVRAAKEIVALRSILRRPGVARFAIFAVTVIVGCALVVFAAEHKRDDASIQSLGDAFWWATVTTTTVGYGDEVPVTDQGRMMAVILMGLGVALLAVLTAHIAAYFVDDGHDIDGSDLIHRLERLEVSLAAIEVHLHSLATADRGPTGTRSQPEDHP